MYRYTPFTYLAKEKPDLAKERLLDAMVEAQGNVEVAWTKVGLSSFSWYRYLKILDIKETMTNLRLALRGEPTGQQYSDEAYTPKKPVIT